MLVVDASALVDLLLRRSPADEIAHQIAARGLELHAPELLDLEVVSALRRLVSSGDTSAARAADAIEDLRELPIERHPHGPLVPRVWDLRASLTAYDASYLALAESLRDSGAPLLTTDGRFARAIAASGGVEALLVA